jgi:hypothetical protein
MTDGQSEGGGIMAARVSEQAPEDARIIAFERPSGRERRPGQVVAVVLSDGSVRPLDGPPSAGDGRVFATGQVSGPGWILWWQRRAFEEAR